MWYFQAPYHNVIYVVKINAILLELGLDNYSGICSTKSFIEYRLILMTLVTALSITYVLKFFSLLAPFFPEIHFDP